MTTTLIRRSNLPDFAAQAAGLAVQVRQMLGQASTPIEAMEVHARIQAAKAWAKAHRQLRDIRLDLLAAEVECLVRVWELGGANLLTAVEAAAASWFAEMTPSLRAATITKARNVSTAAGLHRWYIRVDNARSERVNQHSRGHADAAQPDAPPAEPPAARASRSVRDVLRSLIEERTETGVPFDVATVADDLLAATFAGDMDEDYVEGARHVVQHAITHASPDVIDGTIIPKVITIRTAAGYIRIPTASATLAHLDEWLAFRQEQADLVVAATERVRKFVERVRSINPSPTGRVADTIAASMQQAPANSA